MERRLERARPSPSAGRGRHQDRARRDHRRRRPRDGDADNRRGRQLGLHDRLRHRRHAERLNGNRRSDLDLHAGRRDAQRAAESPHGLLRQRLHARLGEPTPVVSSYLSPTISVVDLQTAIDGIVGVGQVTVGTTGANHTSRRRASAKSACSCSIPRRSRREQGARSSTVADALGGTSRSRTPGHLGEPRLNVCGRPRNGDRHRLVGASSMWPAGSPSVYTMTFSHGALADTNVNSFTPRTVAACAQDEQRTLSIIDAENGGTPSSFSLQRPQDAGARLGRRCEPDREVAAQPRRSADSPSRHGHLAVRPMLFVDFASRHDTTTLVADATARRKTIRFSSPLIVTVTQTTRPATAMPTTSPPTSGAPSDTLLISTATRSARQAEPAPRTSARHNQSRRAATRTPPTRTRR